MSRKTINIAIRVLPGGQIRAVKDPSGSTPIYEDQLTSINQIMKKARTIQDAKELLYTSSIHYDRHHNDPNVPTPKTMAQANMRRVRNTKVQEKDTTTDVIEDSPPPAQRKQQTVQQMPSVQLQQEEPQQKSKGVVQPQPKSSH